jgi:hypothetical protein
MACLYSLATLGTPVPDAIKHLVDRFDQNRDAYIFGTYNEIPMLDLKKQQARAPKKQAPSQKQLLDQKLAITDHQIDTLVYELYRLTEHDIRIAERPRGKSLMRSGADTWT